MLRSPLSFRQGAWIQFGAQIRKQGLLARIYANRTTDFPALLGGPGFEGDGCTCISGPVAKGRDTAAGFVHQIFKIIKGATTGLEAFQQRLARVLPLEGVPEHDVPMWQSSSIFGQFLEAKDDRISWCRGP